MTLDEMHEVFDTFYKQGKRRGDNMVIYTGIGGMEMIDEALKEEHLRMVAKEQSVDLSGVLQVRTQDQLSSYPG